jgi:hypothetical protein
MVQAAHQRSQAAGRRPELVQALYLRNRTVTSCGKRRARLLTEGKGKRSGHVPFWTRRIGEVYWSFFAVDSDLVYRRTVLNTCSAYVQ